MRRISQQTFDDVVRENTEEFEMEKAEAIREAVEQFRKQGIDLSNIDITGGEGRKQLIEAIQVIQNTAIHSDEGRQAKLLMALDEVKAVCDKSHVSSRRNLLIMEEEGGFNALLWHLDSHEHDVVLVRVLQVLLELCSQQESTRDLFEPGGSSKLVSFVRSLLERSEEATEALALSLALGKVVSRSEENKNALMKASMGPLLSELLVSMSTKFVGIDIPATSTTTATAPSASWLASITFPSDLSKTVVLVLEKACQLVRGLSTFDDFRAEMSCAHDNGRFFLKQPGVLSTLQALASGYKQYPELASAALSALRAFVNTNEAVQLVCQQPLLDLLLRCLRETSAAAAVAAQSEMPASSAVLIRAVMGLIRNVAADDVKKEHLVGAGVLDLCLHLLSQPAFSQEATIVEHIFGSLAQMTLRSPSNAQRLMHRGAAELFVAAMRRHNDREALLRQACLTIRNIAGRSPELRSGLLDAGIEAVLRDSGRLSGCVDEAYSALRDLGCDVQFVRVAEDGSVIPAFEQFGARGALNFRPVYDEAPDLDHRMESEARAPFAVDDHDHRHHHDYDHTCDDC